MSTRVVKCFLRGKLVTAVLFTCILLLFGCDRFGPDDEDGLQTLDADPLEVEIHQRGNENGEPVTRDLGRFEAPWRTAFPLRQAAQMTISFESTLEVDVDGVSLERRLTIFLVLRSHSEAPDGKHDVHLRVFYPGEGTTVTQIRRPFEGTAYAFFVEGISTSHEEPIQLLLEPDDGASRSLTVDPASHTLPLRPSLQFGASDLSAQVPDAGQTSIRITNPLFSQRASDRLPFQPFVLIYHHARQLAFQPDFEPDLGEPGTFHIRFLEPLHSSFRFYLFMVDH